MSTVHTPVPVQVPIHHVPSFDFDDAFSDTEDADHSFNFSRDTIRQELAKSRPGIDTHWTEPEDMAAPNGFFEASVSIIDTNGTHSASGSSEQLSVSRPRSPAESEVSSHFSQISLSVSGPISPTAPADDEPEPEPDPQPQPDPQPESVQHDLEVPHVEVAPYPNVVIDISKPPSNRVSLTSERFIPIPNTSHQPSPPSSPPSTSTAHPSPQTPQTSRSLPASASHSPGPSTPTLSASSASLTASISPATPHSPSVFLTPGAPGIQAQLQPPQKPFVHRPTRSVGPSALEKVVSRTRPSFLPPKSRQEDDKHMADWKAMMKHSRIAAENRRKALQERRIVREMKVEESLYIWERDIVPNWKVVHKNPALRKLWWSGIPTKLRATMWENAVGNALALSKDNYRSCLARAKRALASGTFPSEALVLVESDIASTLPVLHIFHQESGPLYAELKDMLCAWVVSRSDEGLGYTMGAAKIAAMFLINMPVQQGFVVMRNLMERHCMRSFYGGDGAKDDVEAYYRIFDTLLADGMPKIYFNFKQHQISPSAYLLDWLLPLFLNHLPFEACARIWDVLLLEGDSFLYRAALGILGVLEPRLFFPDRRELLELLRGENKAALDVARREGRELNGGKYEIYGVDEETLWERIDSMEDWWKESTWTRLIHRELPDL